MKRVDKKLFIGLLLVVMFAGMISAWSFLNIDLTEPSDSDIFSTEIDSFNWSFSFSDFPIDSCWYDLNGDTFEIGDCFSNSSNFLISQNLNDLTLHINNTFGFEDNDSITFFIDTIFPTDLQFTNLNSDDSLDTNETNMEVSFTETNNESCWLEINSVLGNYDSCDNVFSIVQLNEGYNDITFYINDSAGNENSTEITNVFVDGIAPVIDVLSLSESLIYTNGDNLDLIVSLDEANYVEYVSGKPIYRKITYPNLLGEDNYFSLNSSNISDCSLTPSEPQEGNYTYLIKAKDQFRETELTGTIIRDTTAPTISIFSPTNNSNHSGIVDIKINSLDSLSGIENITLLVQYLNGTEIYSDFNDSSETPTFSWNSYTLQGTFNITATATDKAGNSNSTNTIINVDNVPPQIDILYPINSTVYNYNNILFNATADEEISLWIISLNEDNESVTIPFSKNLSDGNYNLTIYAKDTFGNTGLNNSVSFSVDTTAPELTLIGEDTITLEFGEDSYVEQNAMAFDLRQGGLNSSIIINNSNLNESQIGTYTIIYSVTDDVGNTAYVNRIVIIQDTNAPNLVLIDLILNNSHYAFDNNNLNFNYFSNDFSNYTCEFYINDLVNQIGIANYSLTNLESGKYKWSINCSDFYTNPISSETFYFTILPEINLTGFDSATNLTSVSDISAVENFEVNHTNGNINYTELIDFSSGFDWTQYIQIGTNFIYVNSSGQSLLDKSANLTFYNLTYGDLDDFKIYKDSSIYSEATADYSNGTLTFSVTGFSNYTTASNHNNDGVCDLGETCSNAPNDCGACPSTPSVSSGGSSGGSSYSKPKVVVVENETEEVAEISTQTETQEQETPSEEPEEGNSGFARLTGNVVNGVTNFVKSRFAFGLAIAIIALILIIVGIKAHWHIDSTRKKKFKNKIRNIIKNNKK
jgi:Bacterial surface protein, Ig-like domain/Bacterial Ig domain